ncbi:MAG: heme lyase CcmF/NrfE family subunit [Gemmatimonadetes bacterium]|nr:heme lyase CcmF/NrfE family subunit [Gemmatimonadota bacterium]
MTLLGQFALWAALALGLYQIALALVPRWKADPATAGQVTRISYGIALALWVAGVSLWKALFIHDFNVEYVASYTARNLPDYYIFAAFWAGQKGSLLFWALVLASFNALAQATTSRRYASLLPAAAAVGSAVVVFFLVVMLFSGFGNPFQRLSFTPPDGNGLNPQLQNPGMVIHPPMLYLGYIGITVPFSFAISALINRRLDAGWIVAIRRWTLLAWLFLSIGITIGMWWAYVELGWGGYWAWDPVENASLLPWLTMTAFLHSVMLQEKRGMLKRWNLGLVVGSFLLSIFGTFITRSGVIASVHSFTQSNIGSFFVAFLVLVGGASFALLYLRWPDLEPEANLDSLASREAAFLFNNLILVGIAFSVLWGTLFPILSEAVRGTKITVGPPFFNRVNVPLGLVLLALTGIGPLIAWRQTSPANLKRQFTVPLASGILVTLILALTGMRDGYALMAIGLGGFVLGTIGQEFVRGVRARQRMYQENAPVALGRLMGRNRRRYGGYLVHAAIVVYFVAFSGMAFTVSKEATLRVGERVTIDSPFGHRYQLTHLGVSQYDMLNRKVSAASLEVTRDGERVGVIKSEKRQHVDDLGRPTFQPSTEVGIISGLREDLYLVFAGSVDGTERSTFRITLNPLVWWVWAGGVLLVVGGLITMWPSSWQPSTVTLPAQAPARAREPLAGVG